jgi:hypothetical protein
VLLLSVLVSEPCVGLCLRGCTRHWGAGSKVKAPVGLWLVVSYEPLSCMQQPSPRELGLPTLPLHPCLCHLTLSLPMLGAGH